MRKQDISFLVLIFLLVTILWQHDVNYYLYDVLQISRDDGRTWQFYSRSQGITNNDDFVVITNQGIFRIHRAFTNYKYAP